jgi:hypothetical protein
MVIIEIQLRLDIRGLARAPVVTSGIWRARK